MSRIIPRLAHSTLIAAGLTASVLAGCSSDDAAAKAAATTTITVADDPRAVSSNPSDDLFRITITGGPSLAPSELSVTVQFGSGSVTTYTSLSIVDDANKNQRVDVGEVLSVNEGPGNLITEAYVGQTANIALVRAGQTLATGAWKVTN